MSEAGTELKRWKTVLPVVDQALAAITGKRLSGHRAWNEWWRSEAARKWRKANEE